jgi:hypothetical protein
MSNLLTILLLTAACVAQNTRNLHLNIAPTGVLRDILMNQTFTIPDGAVALKGPATDATIYVSTTGNDGNDGLSPGTAKLTLSAAHTACPATCIISISQGGLTLSSSVTFTKSVTLKCEPRATITYTTNARQLIFNGQGSSAVGCGFAGTGSGNTGSPPIVSTNSFFVFDHNSISSFGSTDGAGELSITSGNIVSITNNIFNENGDADIEVLNAHTSQIMYSILIAQNIASDIIISNSGTSASLAALSISNNGLNAGEAGKTNPCLKISSLSSINIADVVVAANNCVLSRPGPPTAYSIADTTAATFTGNIYDASGMSGTVNGLLLSSVNFVNVTGNTIANNSAGTGISITGSDANVEIGTNNIGFAVTGISIGALAAGTSIAHQKFASVITTYSDSGIGTDIQNRSYAGTVTLSSGTGTFTIPSGGAFTSTSTFTCNTNDTTTITIGSKAVPATTTTAAVTGTGSDAIAVTCTGY